MSALLGGLEYVLPLLAFLALAVALIGLLWPPSDAYRRNHGRKRRWRRWR